MDAGIAKYLKQLLLVRGVKSISAQSSSAASPKSYYRAIDSCVIASVGICLESTALSFQQSLEISASSFEASHHARPQYELLDGKILAQIVVFRNEK